MPYKNPEDRLRQVQRYRAEHAEELKAYWAAYYLAHREKYRQQSTAYYQMHREEIQAQQARYRATNPAPVRESKLRHKARKRGSMRTDLSPAQWEEIKAAYGHRCVYCGRKMKHLTQDHIIPLSKGGNHTASNIVPACLSCNQHKSAGAPLCPVQPLLVTLAPPQKKRKK